MSLKRIETAGLIEKIKFSDKQIVANIRRAIKDLKTAKATIKIDEEWNYTIAYHAMLRSGRALMFSKGYRPKGKDQHKTVVDFCEGTIGEEFRHLTERFNRMRIKRHNFIYEPERPIPKTEVTKSLESAENFVKKITSIIQKTHPQKKLF